MAADPNIFSQYLQPVKSVADYSADMDKAESNKLALAAARLKNQTDQQDYADNQTYRQAAAQSGGDQNKLVAALMSQGLVKQAQAIQSSGLVNAKTVAETYKATAQAGQAEQAAAASKATQQYEAALHHAQGLAYVQTPQDVQTYIQQGISKGVFPPMSPEQIQQKLAQFPSVEAFKQAAQQAAVPVVEQFKQQAENARNKLNNDTLIANNTATNATSRANNAAQVGATIRGQNLTDARSREATAATIGKPFEVTGPDGQPVLVQQDKAGNITPVQGYSPKGAGSTNLNDSQSKSLLFGERMRQADKVLNDLSATNTTTSVPGSRTPVVGGIVNALSSDSQQKLNQAKLDFMTAVLRRESGAAISDGEYNNADKQYFPQVGDSKAVIAQKQANRQLAINGVLAEVPEKQRNSITPKTGQSAPATNIDALLNKYK